MTIRPLRDVLDAPPSDHARAVHELLAHLWGTEGELWDLPARLCEPVVVRCLRAAMQNRDPDAALLAAREAADELLRTPLAGAASERFAIATPTHTAYALGTAATYRAARRERDPVRRRKPFAEELFRAATGALAHEALAGYVGTRGLLPTVPAAVELRNKIAAAAVDVVRAAPPPGHGPPEVPTGRSPAPPSADPWCAYVRRIAYLLKEPR